MKIGLCGASGKVGQILSERVNAYYSRECHIEATFNSRNALNELANFCQNSDVVIDFSSPVILQALVENATRYKTKLVIGTTGLTLEHFKLLEEAAKVIPLMYSANMSVGANLLSLLATRAAAILADYDSSIIEYHHRHKKDAPSGTALMIAKAMAEYTPKINDNIFSIRSGGIYGQHDVLFANDDELITLSHQALNRKAFADGAIKAALWLHDKPAGLYSMLDVLGSMLKTNSV